MRLRFEFHRHRAVIFLLLALGFLVGCHRQEPKRSGLSVQEILGDPAQAGFEKALLPRPFQFPQDHGPHFGFRNEWWYVTGNLHDETGRRYGFQLTFFRHQLRPENRETTGWQAPQIYMGHFAVTDIGKNDYQFFERFGRPAAGIAGAQTQPLAVWIDDWRLEFSDNQNWQLHAQAGSLRLLLQLTPTLAPVAQGDAGLSRKSTTPGNASYYYSIVQMRAQGRLRDRDGVEHIISGRAWLDREWSTSALDTDQAGWDWFALQLNDGRALMLYQLRRSGGGVDPFSYAALIAADGSKQILTPDQFELTPLDYWNSPAGTRYPIRWRLRIAALGIDWRINASLAQQWFNASVSYWEGAVTLESGPEHSPLGEGYLEMTGY